MIKLHATPNAVHLMALRTHLRDAEIKFDLRNEILGTLAGEVPADVFPEIWIDEVDAKAAFAILEKLKSNNWVIEIDEEALIEEALSHGAITRFSSQTGDCVDIDDGSEPQSAAGVIDKMGLSAIAYFGWIMILVIVLMMIANVISSS